MYVVIINILIRNLNLSVYLIKTNYSSMYLMYPNIYGFIFDAAVNLEYN